MDIDSAEIECSNGQIIASHRVVHFLGGYMMASARKDADGEGEGWKWEMTSGDPIDVSDVASDGWGPMRWKFATDRGYNSADESGIIALSCWLLAPLLALWPVISIVLFARRRTRRRRRLASGHCLPCGYDLRATPSPGGETLSRCPECGAEDQTPGSRGAKAKLEDR